MDFVNTLYLMSRIVITDNDEQYLNKRASKHVSEYVECRLILVEHCQDSVGHVNIWYSTLGILIMRPGSMRAVPDLWVFSSENETWGKTKAKASISLRISSSVLAGEG